MITVPISGHGGSISIEVLGYENTAATNESDANWLKSRIRIVAGPFSGELDASLTTQDFVYLERELTDVLRTFEGKATFQTDEDWLYFQIEMGSRGAAIISGALKANSGSRTSLSFSFETDQSYLTQTKHALAQVLKCFPIRSGGM
jgi:hypothetical protein